MVKTLITAIILVLASLVRPDQCAFLSKSFINAFALLTTAALGATPTVPTVRTKLHQLYSDTCTLRSVTMTLLLSRLTRYELSEISRFNAAVIQFFYFSMVAFSQTHITLTLTTHSHIDNQSSTHEHLLP